MKDLTILSRFAFSLSLLALAASIAYFTVELAQVRTTLPELLQQIDNTVQTVEPVVSQFENINQLIPGILEEVRQTRELISPVLSEVSQIRKVIPDILEEVRQTRELIPPVLSEASQIRKVIPVILLEVEQTRKIIPDILEEVKQTRQQIPPVLAEVKATRELAPILMSDANKLADNIHTAGKEASQGAVTGFFSGILRAPFAIVGDIGSTVMGFTNKDKEEFTREDLNMAYKASLDLLNSDTINTTKEIVSKDGKITLTLLNIDTTGDTLCKTIHARSTKGDKVISDNKNVVCKNEDGKWQVE